MPPSANTDVNGYATVTLTLTQLAANVHVHACVAPTNSRWQAIDGSMVLPSIQNLQTVSGLGQAVTLGQSFQPLRARSRQRFCC